MKAVKASVDSSTQNEIVNVYGLVIKTNSLYIIQNKLDKSAPDGYIKAGTTKLPSEGIGNSVSCRWQDLGNGRGIYDTGLFEESPCYNTKTSAEKATIVKSLQKHIVKPYQELYLNGGSETLDAKNTAFWDSYTVDLYEGRVFNTEKVDELLALFVAVNSRDLTPDIMMGSPEFGQSDYVIKDSESSMSVAKQRIKAKMDSSYHFMGLLATQKQDLLTILKYLNIVATHQEANELDLQSAFSLWIEKDVQNPDKFESTYTKYTESEKGKEEIILTVQVKKYIELGRIKKEGTEYLYKGTPLGKDLRSCVMNLKDDEDLTLVKDEIRMG